MELGTLVWVIVAVILVWLILDLLVAGGGMTGGMMAGMGGMMGSPIGWGAGRRGARATLDDWVAARGRQSSRSRSSARSVSDRAGATALARPLPPPTGAHPTPGVHRAGRGRCRTQRVGTRGGESVPST